MDPVGLTLKKPEYLIQQHREAHQKEDENLKVPVSIFHGKSELRHAALKMTAGVFA